MTCKWLHRQEREQLLLALNSKIIAEKNEKGVEKDDAQGYVSKSSKQNNCFSWLTILLRFKWIWRKEGGMKKQNSVEWPARIFVGEMTSKKNKDRVSEAPVARDLRKMILIEQLDSSHWGQCAAEFKGCWVYLPRKDCIKRLFSVGVALAMILNRIGVDEKMISDNTI